MACQVLPFIFCHERKQRAAKQNIYVHLVPEVVHYIRQVADVQMQSDRISPQKQSRKRVRESADALDGPDADADAPSDNEDEEVEDQLDESWGALW